MNPYQTTAILVLSLCWALTAFAARLKIAQLSRLVEAEAFNLKDKQADFTEILLENQKLHERLSIWKSDYAELVGVHKALCDRLAVDSEALRYHEEHKEKP